MPTDGTPTDGGAGHPGPECDCVLAIHRVDLLDREYLGMDDDFGEVSVETCRHCGTRWVEYLLEDEYETASGRWWRAPFDPADGPRPTTLTARSYLESRDWRIVGGSAWGGRVHVVRGPVTID
ncbi:MAG: hypothetical protein R2737_06220 [Candidatus Nanopelagicales bacterium]